ncbi:S8 family serine peptidase [bacterium]|nr:S8 family serine peptidase [bacterium]
MHALARRLVAISLVLVAFASIASAQAIDHPYKGGEVLLKFKPGTAAVSRSQVMGDLGGSVARTYQGLGVELVRLDGITVEEAVGRFAGHPALDFIEPNYELTMFTVPNDPRFPELYGLQNTGQTGGTPGADISAVEAWSTFTGSSDVIVAVIDTGVDYNHPDLTANMWINQGEIVGNGIDDDGNGWVDDIVGYDYVNGDANPMDDNGHGTHCSGTIGGVGDNGVGVAGVNWTVSIMALKFLSSFGSGSTADAISCIQYATQMGADVMSNSWGGGGYSEALELAIQEAYDNGIIFVAAAGNNGSNTDLNTYYPQGYDVPNVVSVAATDHNDQLASFSNYGVTSVDLAAPGVEILSTTPGNTYSVYSGTSMATPHVAGAFAMLKGRFPNLGVEDAINIIYSSVDVLPQLQNRCLTGGRLNLHMAISDPDTTAPGMITDLAAGAQGSSWAELTWTATGDDGDTGTAASYEMRYSSSMVPWDLALPVDGEPAPQPAGGAESLRLGGLDFSSTYYVAVRALDDYGNMGPVSNLAMVETLGPPAIAVSPGSLSETLPLGGSSQQTLTITNTGEGVLDFAIPDPLLLDKSAAPVVHDFVYLAKGQKDARRGEAVITGSGGPDLFGYRWTDSDEPGGPVFDWVDISAVGTPVITSGDDVNAGPFPLGFDFPFYGNVFDQFRVCSNGWLSFTSSSTAYSNQAIPNAGAPGNLIAPFWDDLTVTGARILAHNDGGRVIVQYDAVPHYGGGGPYTFQALLYPSGKIVYQYLTMGTPSDGCTVGIQNADGTDGLQVAFNTAYVHDGLAIKIQAVPQWITVSPAAGSLAAGESMDLIASFSAADLEAPAYDAEIVVFSNDAGSPQVVIPAHLDLTGSTALVVTVTPQGAPVTIPATGGTFTYDVEITNTTAADITASVGVQAVLPNGTTMLLTRLDNQLFPAGGTVGRSGLTQAVPAAAPAGDYTYQVGVGYSQAQVIDADGFGFMKLVAKSAGAPVSGWDLKGWDLLGDPARQDGDRTPAAFALSGAVPNPFNPMTTLAFDLPRTAAVRLEVYDMRGKLVRTLLDGVRMEAGRHEAVWRGDDQAGRPVAGGVYFYRMRADDFESVRRMTLVK